MSPEDYIDGVYIKLAEIIYRMNDEDEKILPADMVNYFTTVEEQKRVSEVFSVKFNYENVRELEKALTEEIVLLKKAKADHLSRNASSAEDIQKVIEIKKNLNRINIVLGDHY